MRVLRDEKVYDLYEVLQNKSLQNLQMPSKVVKVAKVKKNNKSSPIKLASLRTKKEDK
tara:strand:- start:5072 stop:5245 length:174 start_codon:yes stop_codon:yes gene_type:complete